MKKRWSPYRILIRALVLENLSLGTAMSPVVGLRGGLRIEGKMLQHYFWCNGAEPWCGEEDVGAP